MFSCQSQIEISEAGHDNDGDKDDDTSSSFCVTPERKPAFSCRLHKKKYQISEQEFNLDLIKKNPQPHG